MNITSGGNVVLARRKPVAYSGMADEISVRLTAQLKELPHAPFLFIGSGLSRRYYNLPDWQGLLKDLSAMCGLNYDEYYSKRNGDLPAVATDIAAEFHKFWFRDEKFKDSREIHSGRIKNIDDPIKIEAANLILSRQILSESYALEIEEFKNIIIDGIITTNYDTLMENIFEDGLVPYIGQQQMISRPIQHIGEIYKIHGCASDPTTMILTSEDYRKFTDHAHYLSAILTKIFVEHPVIFFGYSISDANIQLILSNVVKCMDSEAIERLSDRLIFVNRLSSEKEIESIEYSSIYFNEINAQIPITKIKTNDFSIVYKVLQKFDRKLSLRSLRMFKETAYSIALSKNPESKILFTDPDAQNTDGMDFVFGHGAIKNSGVAHKGIIGITREDVWKNILEMSDDYTSEDVLEGLKHLSKSSALLPIGKYYIESGKAEYTKEGWVIDIPEEYTESQTQRTLDYFGIPFDKYALYLPNRDTLAEFRSTYRSVKDVERNFDTETAIRKMSLLNPGDISPDELKDFLTKVFDQPKNQTTQSFFVKLVALYDRVKYISPKELIDEDAQEELIF